MNRKQEEAAPRKTVIYGSAVALKGAAVFLRGKTGTGKSDLSLRMVEILGAELVSDDQVAFEWRQEKVFALPAENIKGMLELRGVGLVRYPYALSAPLRLIVDLVMRADVPRLPEWGEDEVLGTPFPCLKLHGFDASTPFKIAKAMEIAARPELLVR